MTFSLRSFIRPVGAALTCLMLLTQTACVSFSVGASAVPEPPEGEPRPPGEGVSDLGSFGPVLLIGAVVVGGYLIYKAVTYEKPEEEEETETATTSEACAGAAPADPWIPVGADPEVPVVREMAPCGGAY